MKNNNIKILIAGEGGQGIQKMARILADSAYKQGLQVSYMPHYGVEMRMGISFAYIQICDDKISNSNSNLKSAIAYPKFSKADILAVLGSRDIQIPISFIAKTTKTINTVGLEKILQEQAISNRSFNMLVLGVVVKEINKLGYNLNPGLIKKTIKEKLAGKGKIDNNLKAFELGLKLEEKKYSRPLSTIKRPVLKPAINQDSQKQHIRFANLCKGCGLCIAKCPVRALFWSKDKINFISRPIPEVDIKKCTACGICEQICPDSAIRLIKK